MSKSNGQVRLDPAFLKPPSEIEISVTFLNGDRDFVAFMADQDPRTDREYTRIANRHQRAGQLKQKDLLEAMESVFQIKFLRTNIDWNIYNGSGEPTGSYLTDMGFDDEKSYFLRDEVGKRYMRTIVNSWFGAVSVDASYTKD